jgi:hypothetical protein
LFFRLFVFFWNILEYFWNIFGTNAIFFARAKILDRVTRLMRIFAQRATDYFEYFFAQN